MVLFGWPSLAALDKAYGGEGGIRTPDTLSGMAAFEAARFNRSRTSPRQIGTVAFRGERLLCSASFYQSTLGLFVARKAVPVATAPSLRTPDLRKVR